MDTMNKGLVSVIEWLKRFKWRAFGVGVMAILVGFTNFLDGAAELYKSGKSILCGSCSITHVERSSKPPLIIVDEPYVNDTERKLVETTIYVRNLGRSASFVADAPVFEACFNYCSHSYPECCEDTKPLCQKNQMRIEGALLGEGSTKIPSDTDEGITLSLVLKQDQQENRAEHRIAKENLAQWKERMGEIKQCAINAKKPISCRIKFALDEFTWSGKVIGRSKILEWENCMLRLDN